MNFLDYISWWQIIVVGILSALMIAGWVSPRFAAWFTRTPWPKV